MWHVPGILSFIQATSGMQAAVCSAGKSDANRPPACRSRSRIHFCILDGEFSFGNIGKIAKTGIIKGKLCVQPDNSMRPAASGVESSAGVYPAMVSPVAAPQLPT
jgi:hypothetical protein